MSNKDYLTVKERFLLFYPRTKCYKTKDGFCIDVYHHTSNKRIRCVRNTAREAWESLWYYLNRRMMFNMSSHTGMVPLEIPLGFMFPDDKTVYDWDKFCLMPEYFPVWIDILHDSDVFTDVDEFQHNALDIMLSMFDSVVHSSEVCD